METNGIILPQKILAFLSGLDAPANVHTISLQLGSSLKYTRNVLTTLKSADLVREARGQWTISPLGRELHKQDPHFSNKFAQPPKEKLDLNVLSRFLAPELVEKSYLTRMILQHANNFREWKEAESILIPFVAIWMCANKIEPKFEFTSELPEVDEEIEEIFRSFIALAKDRFK